MKFRYGIKQIIACATAFVIAASIVVSNYDNESFQIVSQASYQNQINEYQQQLDDLKNQQAALDEQIQANKDKLENELAYQADIQNQIGT